MRDGALGGLGLRAVQDGMSTLGSGKAREVQAGITCTDDAAALAGSRPADVAEALLIESPKTLFSCPVCCIAGHFHFLRSFRGRFMLLLLAAGFVSTW